MKYVVTVTLMIPEKRKEGSKQVFQDTPLCNHVSKAVYDHCF